MKRKCLCPHESSTEHHGLRLNYERILKSCPPILSKKQTNVAV
jgi:hypothetical protein